MTTAKLNMIETARLNEFNVFVERVKGLYTNEPANHPADHVARRQKYGDDYGALVRRIAHTRDQAETYLLNTMVGCGKIVNKDWYSGYLRALAEVLDLIASYEDGTIDPIPEEYL